MSKLRAALRLLAFLSLILLFLPPLQLAILLRREDMRDGLLRRFYALGARTWGVRIMQEGKLDVSRPLLVISNHSSYLDIPVLGQAGPPRFTPKLEIRGWPVIGWLCVLAGCVFIDRRREKTQANKGNLEEALRQGRVISLFPESSTNDGFGLLPFRSSYFSLAETHPGLAVQPVSIRYTRPDGSTLDRAAMDKVAWYAEMEFVPHLWEYLQTDGVRALLTFHPSVTLERFGDRKALARYCEAVIGRAAFPQD